MIGDARVEDEKGFCVQSFRGDQSIDSTIGTMAVGQCRKGLYGERKVAREGRARRRTMLAMDKVTTARQKKEVRCAKTLFSESR